MPDIQVKIALTSDPAVVQELRPRLTTLALESGLSSAADPFASAVTEALNNCIEHAYGNVRERPIELTWTADARSVQTALRDWGKPMEHLPRGTCPDPLSMPDGGWGWFIIRSCTDEVIYSTGPDGNLLTLVKHLP